MFFNYRIHYTLLFAFVFSFFFHPVYSQNAADSCSRLKFHSEIEKEGFNTLCSGQKPDYLTMAVAVNPNSGTSELTTIRQVIKTEALFLKAGIADIKKPAAKLKYIFDHVQNTLLKHYDLDADFSEMFENGKHNCLTATLLYTLLLDELSIKYTIKFMPGHVYPIVYANNIPYIFETTDPVHGFVELNSNVQKEAIQSMRLMQFISSDNGANKSTGNLFDRYYIKLNNTEMKGLVAYQYTNASFVAMLKQDFSTAYDLITKGILLTPMDEMFMMQEELLKQSILLANTTSTKRAVMLVTYYNTTKNENKKNQVADEFKHSVYIILFSSFPSPDSLLPVYKTFYNGIKDEDMRDVLEDTYTSQYLEYLQTNDRREDAFELIYAAYTGGNKSAFIKNQMHNCINELTLGLPFNNSGVKEFDSLVLKYPAIMDFDVFVYNRCQVIINAAGQAFKSKNGEEGERLLKKFDEEGYYDKTKPSYCNPASVYSLAGSYYFKKGNTAKAKASLNKGLTFDPDNYEIIKKLRELN